MGHKSEILGFMGYKSEIFEFLSFVLRVCFGSYYMRIMLWFVMLILYLTTLFWFTTLNDLLEENVDI